MAGRSRTSFQKRQKEIARMEKQRDKAAKRAQRRLAAAQPQADENPAMDDENLADENLADENLAIEETAPGSDTHSGSDE